MSVSSTYSHAPKAAQFPPRSQKAKVGLRILLMVFSLLFFLLIGAFLFIHPLSDWEYLTAPWKPLSNPWFLWLNTLVLLISNVALHWACISVRNNNLSDLIKGLSLSGLLSIAFLIGQMLVWIQLVSLGYFLSNNPANSFFYLLTGLHALHVIGGLVAWVKSCSKVRHGYDIEKLVPCIELCTMYWNYLLGLWLLLMLLLTSSPVIFITIVKICGF